MHLISHNYRYTHACRSYFCVHPIKPPCHSSKGDFDAPVKLWKSESYEKVKETSSELFYARVSTLIITNSAIPP